MKRKFYRCIPFLPLIFSIHQTAMSQAPAWAWAKAITGTDGQYSHSIATDAFGNAYTTGYFSGTVDFDPGTGVFNLSSAGAFDIFISKLDNAGNFIWAKAIGGTGSDVGWAIAVDAQNNIYTTGVFSTTTDFDPDTTLNFDLTSNGFGDIFISKLDSAGNFVWAKSAGGPANDNGYSITVDATGNVYTTGYFALTADFDPDSSAIFNLSSAGYDDIFISKSDNAGNFIWAKSMGGINTDRGCDIAVDISGNVYTTGYFSTTVDFDPDLTGTFNLASNGLDDIFIIKLDGLGNFGWAKNFGGPGSDVSWSVALDASNNVYTTGSFQGTADFDPDSSVTFNLISTGGSDIFISKLNSSGNFAWAKGMGNSTTSGEIGLAIVIDTYANIYITGMFAGTVDFDPDSSGIFNLTSSGIQDIFVFKGDSSGNFAWAKAGGGTDTDAGMSIALDNSGSIYITGNFTSDSLTLDSTTLTNADTSGTTYDLFIAKLDQSPVGIESAYYTDDVSFYPNPVQNLLHIHFYNDTRHIHHQITITNLFGKTVFQGAAGKTIDVSGFSNGMYLCKIIESGIAVNKKFVVLH